MPLRIRFSRISSLVACTVALALAANGTEPPLDSIPEPMVFDLVRPLGAKKGELEVNTLLHRTHRQGAPWSWAPEIEYAFADGYSAELEFPFEDGHLRQYKAAVQGTLPTSAEVRLIHGWQAIGRLNRGDNSWSADMLYLTGYRLNRSWSLFSMQGARRTRPFQRTQWAGIANPSVFRSIGTRWSGGLETNFVLGPTELQQQLLIPQAQVKFGEGWIFQAGVGVERLGAAGPRPAFGMRLTKVIQ